jgi:hypothetical protein
MGGKVHYDRVRYKSRRERVDRHGKNLRMVFIFVAIAAIVLIYKHRVSIYDWIRYSF